MVPGPWVGTVVPQGGMHVNESLASPIGSSPIHTTETILPAPGDGGGSNLAHRLAQGRVESPAFDSCASGDHPSSPDIKQEFWQEKIEEEPMDHTEMALDQISAVLDESLEMFSDDEWDALE